MGISLDEMPNVDHSVMQIRHKVIHGGYVPTKAEASIAYNDTRKALLMLVVPMFE